MKTMLNVALPKGRLGKKIYTMFENAGFEILEADEAFCRISFSDVGAFVWFAHIIEWEFPGFSVDRCFDRLMQMQETIQKSGEAAGRVHRYLLVAKKPKGE